MKINIKPGPLKPLSLKERTEDILQLYNVLCENYPYFSLKVEKFGYDWLAHKEDFLKWAEQCSSNEEFYLVLKKTIILLQNNHTELVNPLYRQYLAQVYEGNDCWSKVINHKRVIEKYKTWSEMSLPNPYVLPGEFIYMEGKYIYCSKSLSENQKIEALPEGTILEKVSGIPVNKYVKSLIGSRYLHYDYKRSIPISEILRIYTDKIKIVTLGFKSESGESFSMKLKSYKYYPSLHSSTRNKQEEQKNIKVEILEQGSTCCIKINSFASKHVIPDKTTLENLFEKFKHYSKLIIDVRGNGGGNEEYYMNNIVPYIISEKKSTHFYILFRHGEYIKPFLKDRGFKCLPDDDLKLTEELPEEINLSDGYRKNFGFFIINSRNIKPSKVEGFKGSVYILTDHHTYSAAETFSAFVKGTNIATIVGTTTGGDGINLDPCLFALKNSGLVIRFAMSMGLNADGTINEDTHTAPDIYVEQTLQDFMNSRDTVLEYMKKI